MKGFWKACRQVHSCIKSKTKREECTSLWMPKYFIAKSTKRDVYEAIRETRLYVRPFIYLSNLGKVSAEITQETKTGPIHLTEVYRTLTGQNEFEFIQVCFLVLTFEGRFMCNILYNTKKVSKGFVDVYYEHITDVFKTFGCQIV